MLKVLFNNSDEWDQTVKSFRDWDVYYLNGYLKCFELHGDGVPILIYFEGKSMRLCLSVMKSDIYDSKLFDGFLQEGQLYDLSTPYGYGGPLHDGTVNDDDLIDFKSQLDEYCRDNKIVSLFFRFHPLIDNHKLFVNLYEIKYLKKTVVINTETSEQIFSNLKSENRTRIRKAIKNGVEIISDKGDLLNSFINIYKETMDRNTADHYYYFTSVFFHNLIQYLENNIRVFYAIHQGEIIASSIALYNNSYMHYHLSGSRTEYMHLAPTNLLIYEMALWAEENNIKKLHLGGGTAAEDELLRFKRSFNKNGLLDYYIGRAIFLDKEFEALVLYRISSDSKFNQDNNLLIKYRG